MPEVNGMSEQEIFAMSGRRTLNSAYRNGTMHKDGNNVVKGEDIINKEGSANVGQTSAFWYSPELTSETWLLPKSRQEILKWCRIFFNLEPFIQSISMLKAYYAFSRFELTSVDENITDFYTEMSFNENFDMYQFILLASICYEKFGEAIPFLNEEKFKDGPWAGCSRWKNAILLEPELVEIKTDTFTGKRTYELIATDEMSKMVNSHVSDEELIKKGFPVEVIKAVREKKNIPLSDANVSQIARITDPSATRGTSPIQVCFKCLSGDTMIPLLNGNNKTIKQLYDEKAENIHVYSINPKTQTIEPGLVERVMLTDVNRELVKITLDDNSTFKCTPDHKVMLRNGEYKEAKDLLINESLMPLQKELNSILKYTTNNKVKCIEFIKQKEDVFDLINAKPYNNFAILTSQSSGVFVHNSLILQDKIRLAQVAAADRYHMPIELWKVGDIAANILPTPDQLDNIRDMINQAIQNPPFCMVFPPYITYEALGITGKLLPVKEDYDYIQDQIMVGLGVNKNLITGDGPSFSNMKSMSLQNFTMMAKAKRDVFESWMINQFYRPIAIKNKFYYQKGKEKKLVLPQISWYKSLDIEEEAEERKMFIDLHKDGFISTQTLFSKFPSLDFAAEQKKLEKEARTVFDKGSERIPKQWVNNQGNQEGAGPKVLGPGEHEVKQDNSSPSESAGNVELPAGETPVAEAETKNVNPELETPVEKPISQEKEPANIGTPAV